MLKIAYSGLLNAQIAHSDFDKLMEAFFFTAAAARLRIQLARHGALAGRRIAGASFGTLTGRRRGRLGGHHFFRLLAQERLTPAAPARSCWIHLLWWRASCRLVRTKLRCTLQAHDVAIETAQHFGEIVVKSVLGEVWFRRDRRLNIIIRSSSSRQMLWEPEASKASCRRGNGFQGPRCMQLSGARQGVAWSVGFVAALMEGKRLPWRSLQSYPRFACTAGTRSVYCDKTGRESSNRTCRRFDGLGNHVEGTCSFEAQVLTPLSDNTDSGFCSPSRSVYARPKFTKHHWHQITFEQVWGDWAKAPLPKPLCISKSVQSVGRIFGHI